MKKIIRFSFSEKEEDGSILVEAELPEELERSNEMVSQIMQAAYKTELDVDAASEDLERRFFVIFFFDSAYNHATTKERRF